MAIKVFFIYIIKNVFTHVKRQRLSKKNDMINSMLIKNYYFYSKFEIYKIIGNFKTIIWKEILIMLKIIYNL